MSVLITSDIHLTDNPRDEYRWRLFPFLKRQIRKLDINVLLILGDLTDAKDRHSSRLINQIVACFEDLCNSFPKLQIVILKGNHDFIDPNNPFFEFIGIINRIKFISEPTILNLPIPTKDRTTLTSLFLPSTKNWKEEWSDLSFDIYDYIFCHATFEGALSETGFPLPGIPPDIFGASTARIISGDIHSPQNIGNNITYVGSPYRTRFGDTFTPRIIYIDNAGELHDLFFECPTKHLLVISSLDDLDTFSQINPKDQVKIRVKLKRADYPEWPTFRQLIKDAASKKGWEVYGVELVELADSARKVLPQSASRRNAADLVRQFAEAQSLTPDQLKIGLELVQ